LEDVVSKAFYNAAAELPPNMREYIRNARFINTGHEFVTTPIETGELRIKLIKLLYGCLLFDSEGNVLIPQHGIC
jgi:hypothetical protein